MAQAAHELGAELPDEVGGEAVVVAERPHRARGRLEVDKLGHGVTVSGAAARAHRPGGPSWPPAPMARRGQSIEPGPGGARRGRRARGEIELAQDVGDVPVDRVLAEHQPLGDLRIRQPVGEQAEHLALAWRELRQRLRAHRLDARPDLGQPGGGGARLTVGRLGPPERRQAARQLQARLRGLERRSGGREAVDRVLEHCPRALVLARCRRDRAFGEIGRGEQGERAGGSRGVAQLGQPRARLLERPALDARAHEQREHGRAVQPAMLRQPAQHALEQLGGLARRASVQRDPRAAQLRRAGPAGAVQQLPGLRRSPLPAPQLRQRGQRRADHRRPRAHEVLHGRLQHRLGVAPAAAPEVDLAVLGAAEGEHVAAPVALGERRDPVAPFDRALEVQDRGAGRDDEAERPGARHRDRRLPLERRRGRLVEAGHALVDPGAGDQRRALQGQAEHLQVGYAEAAAELGGADRQPLRLRHVSHDAGEIALVEGEPSVLRAGLERFEQAPRAPQPAARHRHGAVEVQLVHRQPRRHARGGGRHPAGAVEAVCALARGEHRLGVVAPPRRPAQALECLGLLAVRQRSLEDRACGVPAPGAQFGPAGVEPV